MTAYGALISLKNTIDDILHSSHFSLSEPSPTILQLAYNELQPLQEILERLDKTRTSRSRKKVNVLDGRIKDKIWEFEDKLESLLYQQILSQIPAAEQVDGDGDGDGDGGIKETTVWPFQGSLMESSHIPSESQTLFQIPPPHGGMKERTVWQFQALLESLPSKFEFQSPPPQQVGLTTRRRKVVHKHKSGRTPTTRRSRDPLLFSIDLQCLQDDVASFIQELKHMKRKYIYELKNMPQEPISTTIGFHFGGPKSKMIGLSDLFQEIKDYLMGNDHGMHVHQIIGTAGIGKTTLAKELYEDADVVSYFECRAWVTVTRTMVDKGPHFDEVVKGIVAQLCGGDTLIQGGDENIGDYLKGKKCLLVLDDVWEDQVLDCLIESLYDIKNDGFYILVITRGASLYAETDTTMRFLTEEESKDLLCHKVFGDQHLCPIELDKAAAKIAKKCEGLPLMIVTVADILSKSQNTEPEYWEEVAEERNSVFTDAYDEISEVLYPSYDYLPQSLKMPFLFMGVFPPDYETPESKLINMLNAEGWFLDTNNKIESMEGSVSDCLDQLCQSRYLVLFKRKSAYWHYTLYGFNSKYKTCWLHSSWRYVCRAEARKNKLYHVLHKLVDAEEEGHRGLCLQNNILFGIKEFNNSVRLNCAPFARSLLFLGPYHQYPTPIDVGFRLLRQLDALQLRFYTFPTEILTLVLLKNLALTCNGELPTTISKLFNLRVLIIRPHMSIRRCRAPSYVPIQIWDMQELEHIEILGKSLRLPNHVASLENLSTLLGVNASICTIFELSRRIPNIRKLGVQIQLMPSEDHNDLLSCFACISKLESLEILKCSIINPVIQYGYIVPTPPSSLMLPRGLRKLHLSGTGFPWEYMDVIGSLPDLQVLKLRSYAFRGSNREAPQERRFRRLDYLLIEDSDLVCLDLSFMDELSRLSLKHCYKLKRIHSLLSVHDYQDREIELVDCNPLAVTWAKGLKPNHRSSLHLTISSSFEAKPVIINLVRYWDDISEQESIGTDDEDTDDDQEDDDYDDDEGIIYVNDLEKESCDLVSDI